MHKVREEFPKDFIWGAAFAANQMEGAYLEGGKGLCVADINEFRDDIDVLHKHNDADFGIEYVNECLESETKMFPKRTGIDFYHTYKDDLKHLGNEGIGFNGYRTSINWARIFPNGDDLTPNEEGLKFYDDLIDEVIANGMEPLITMSHYEMPLNLTTNYKGWYSRETIEFFYNFGKVILDRYSDRVKKWIIVNQINFVQAECYNHLGILFDGIENTLEAKYQAVHNEMVSCAMITKYSHENYSDVEIGMMFGGGNFYAETCKPEDQLAAVLKNKREWFCGDVLIKGEYPKYMFRYFKEQNINIEFGENDIELLKNNTCDFMSFSYYFTPVVNAETLESNKFILNKMVKANPWGWGVDPLGLRTLLNVFEDRYGVPIYITENGIGLYDTVLEDGSIHDEARIDYFKSHVEQMKEAIKDGVDLRGFYAWGPLDIVSCSSSERSKRYGFIYVDLDDYGNGTGKRSPKDSYYYVKSVIESNGNNL